MESQDKYCTIYIVRHGQTHANAKKIVAGHSDFPLTAEGEAQAERRGEAFKDIKFDAVFSSDLVRAKRTAEIITLERGLAVNTKEILRERFFGEWESRPEKEFLEENRHMLEKLKELSEHEKRNLKFSDAYESDVEIATRFITTLREIAVSFLGKTVLVVNHGSMMRALLMHLGFGSHAEIPSGSIENTGYAILESDGVDFFIKETNGINKAQV